jgi:ferrous-iron efflux pump FieF
LSRRKGEAANTMSDRTTAQAHDAERDGERLLVLRKRAVAASVSVAGGLAVIKLAAWLITGSVAVLSSLLDSMVDVFAALVMAYAVRTAVKPPDPSHRYGHGKAEALGAMAQAAFIVGSGLFLIFEAVGRFVEAEPVHQPWIGVGVMVVSIVATLGLVAFQMHVIRVTGSVAIAADRLHYTGDLAMNLAVIAAILALVFLEWTWVDPAAAIGIAIWLIWNAVRVAGGALDQLMDRELPAGDRRRIARILKAHPEVVDYHDLRTRDSGTRQFIELHLELDPSMTVEAAHVVCDQIESELSEAFGTADIIIHQEPAGLEDERLDSQIAESADRTGH